MIKLDGLTTSGFISPAVSDTIALVQAGDISPLYSALVAQGWGAEALNEKVEWGDQKHPSRRTQINNGGAAYGTGTTTLVVDSSAVFYANCLIHCEATNELLLCKSITDGTTIVVARAFGGTAAAAGSVADDAYLKNIGPAMGEASTAPTERDYAATKYANYLQTHRKAISASGRVNRTRPLTGDELKRQLEVAVQEQFVDFEHMLLFGGKNSGVNDAGSKRVTGCAGFYEAISTNVDNIAGTINKARLNQFAAMAFAYGSRRKIGLCGATALRAVSDVFDAKLQTKSGEKAVGLDITEVLTPFGTLGLIYEPHLVGTQAGDIVVVDLPACKLRPSGANKNNSKDLGGRPHTQMNIQGNDVDGSIHQLFAEFTLEYGPELFHARAKGITGYAA